MKPRDELIPTAALVSVFVVALVLISKCQASNWQGRVDAEAKRTQAAVELARIDSALAAAAVARADAYQQERDAALSRAQAAKRDADRLRAQRRVLVPVASQPGAAPTVSDTLDATKAALENCDQETAALRRSIEADSVALNASKQSEAELAGALALQTERGDSLSATVRRQQTLLATADPPCRVLFWNCPSRTTAFAGGAVIATVLTLSLTR